MEEIGMVGELTFEIPYQEAMNDLFMAGHRSAAGKKKPFPVKVIQQQRHTTLLFEGGGRCHVACSECEDGCILERSLFSIMTGDAPSEWRCAEMKVNPERFSRDGLIAALLKNAYGCEVFRWIDENACHEEGE